MTTKLLILMLTILTGSLFAAPPAADVFKLSLDAKEWNKTRHFSRPNQNALVSNVNIDGKKVLKVTLQKTEGVKDMSPSAYRKFTPPVDTGKYTNLRFKIRFSATTSTASVSFYYTGWDKLGWKKIQGVSLTSSVRSKILPAGKWLDIDVACRDKSVQWIFIGARVAKFKPGQKLVAEIMDLEFYTPGVDASIMAERAGWNKFLKTFKVDYSDGKYLTEPPGTNRFATPIAIVKNGQPMAEILYNKHYNSQVVATAAKELQEHIELITGVKIPINSSLRKKGVTKIWLGRTNKIIWRPFLFADEYRQLHGSDGFAIRKLGDELFIFGANDKGTLNGVYTLLENNTDLIWARPNKKFGTIYTSGLKNLDFVWGDNVLDKPASPMRGYMTFNNCKFLARNRCNVMSGGGGDNYWSFAVAKPYGSYDFYSRGGHNIGEFLCMKNPKGDNLEYYGLVSGKRARGNQICFSNKHMRKYFIKSFLDIFRRQPSDIAGANLWLDDTWNWCECKGCNASIKLRDGTIVERNDPAFFSTQAFLFFNELAAAFVKEFPKYKIRIGAYWQTAEPPKCDVHPAIIPMFCPYVRVNDKNPLFSPENIIWLDRLKRWRKKAKTIEIYGYNALGYNFPRPLCHVHKIDFKELYRYTVGIAAEGTTMQWGDDSTKTNNMAMWDYSAIEFWVMNKLSWNPDQDVEKLYKQFCYRAFREAAKPVEKFYGAIREEFFKNSLSTTIGEQGTNITKLLIVDIGRENELRAYLEEAAKLAKHPASQELVKRLRDRFEFYLAKVHNTKTPSVTLPLIRETGKIGFDSPCWKNAAQIDGFQLCDKPKVSAENKTEVAMFHDAKNLYFRIKCFEPDMKKIVLTEIPPGKTEVIGLSSHIEIFLESMKQKGKYYIFSLDAGGRKADVKGYDFKWNGKWTHLFRTFANGWEVIAVIPLSTIDGDLSKGNIVHGTIVREVPGSGKTEYSSWQGGMHHQLNTFAVLTLMR